jgi:hypothetical protein
MEGLLARLVKRAPVARLGHARSQVGRCLGGAAHLVGERRRLGRRHRREVGAARIKGEPDRVRGGLQLGLLETSAFDARARGQRQQTGDVEHDAAIDLGVAAAADAAEADAGIAQAAGLDEVRLGHAQVGEGGAQAGVIEQCNLHGRIGAERLREQRLQLRAVVGVALGVSCEAGRLANAFLRQARDVGQAAVGRHAGAAGQQRQRARAGHCRAQ